MNIRKITKDDFVAVKKLHQQLYNEGDTKYVDFSDDNFECFPISLCLEEDGKIIGYINGEIFGWGGRMEGYINDLFVEESSRGKGYGKELVKKFEEEALKHTNEVYIFASRDFDTEEEDPTKFYEKLGYKVMSHPWLVKILKI